MIENFSKYLDYFTYFFLNSNILIELAPSMLDLPIS